MNLQEFGVCLLIAVAIVVVITIATHPLHKFKPTPPFEFKRLKEPSIKPETKCRLFNIMEAIQTQSVIERPNTLLVDLSRLSTDKRNALLREAERLGIQYRIYNERS